MYGNDKVVTELWAVLNQDGSVRWSRGGSSTRAHLMVYPTQAAAERVLKGPWIKQVIKDRSTVRVERVYTANNNLSGGR